MTKLRPLLVTLAVLAAFSVAAAQGEFVIDQIKSLGTDVWKLSFFIFGLNSTVKRNAAPRVFSKYFWWALSGVIGVLLSFFIHGFGWGASIPLFGYDDYWGTIPYGLLAGLLAVIGRDGVKTLLGWFGLSGSGISAIISPPEGTDTTVAVVPAPTPTPVAPSTGATVVTPAEDPRL